MAATIKDIARETGLGLATISSFLNGGNVREKNRIKIEAAIEDLHYEVNEVAKGLKTNRTKTIGIVLPELGNIFCTEVITEIEDRLRQHEYATIVCDCRSDMAREEEAASFLYKKRVDGIINIPAGASVAHLERFEKAGKPIVLIDRQLTGVACDSVGVDNFESAKMAVNQLLENGHQVIGILAGPDDISTANERLEGYKAALLEVGLPVEERLIDHGNYTIRGGTRGTENLIKHNPDMTALFITNYEMTVGAVIAVNELGVRIPEELSVVGFDNSTFAKACKPKLTIVEQPAQEIADKAAELMLKRLEQQMNTATDISAQVAGDYKPPNGYVNVKLKTRLIAGNSIQNRNVTK